MFSIEYNNTTFEADTETGVILSLAGAIADWDRTNMSPRDCVDKALEAIASGKATISTRGA